MFVLRRAGRKREAKVTAKFVAFVQLFEVGMACGHVSICKNFTGVTEYF
jgi:hypothetical protein